MKFKVYKKYIAACLILAVSGGCCGKNQDAQGKTVFHSGSIPVTDQTSVNTANAVAFSTGVATMFFPPFAAWPFALSVVSASAAVVGGLQTQEQVDYLNAQFKHNFENEMNDVGVALVKNSPYKDKFMVSQRLDWEQSAMKNWHDSLTSVYVISKQSWHAVANGVEHNNSDRSSLYAQFISILGQEKLEDIAKNKDTMTKLALFAKQNATVFQNAVQTLSVSNIKNVDSNSYALSPDVNANFAKLKYCNDATSNKTLRLFDCEYDVLNLAFKDANLTNEQKFKLTDGYNMQIIAAHQLNFIGLEYLYFIEALSNYLNYLNFKAYLAKHSELIQIPSYENINGISFIVSNDSSILNEHSSPEIANDLIRRYIINLNALYGARVNSLYLAERAYLVDTAGNK